MEGPANSSSSLKMEAEGIPEMLVPVYKILRRLVPKYFNCRQILQGDEPG